MIRPLLIVLTLGLATFALTACGGGGSERDVASRDYPAWVADPFYEGQFGAVGSARPSHIGPELTFQQAEASGRNALAATIQTKIQAVFTRYMSQGGEIFADEGGRTIEDMAVEMTRSISRQVTDQAISGSRRKDIWIDGDGLFGEAGQVFVWMVIEREELGLVAAQIRAAAGNEVQRRAYIHADLKTDEALAEMDELIEAELRRSTGEAAPTATN